MNIPYMNHARSDNLVFGMIRSLSENERILSASEDLQDYLQWKQEQLDKEKESNTFDP